MAAEASGSEGGMGICINDILRDDELRAILAKLDTEKEKDWFGLVCKRWLLIQSSERRRLCARAGPLMLRKLASRFTGLLELDLSMSLSRSFYPGVTNDDLSVVASGFTRLQTFRLQYCNGITDTGLMALGNGLPHLRHLDVSYCRKLTDKGLAALAEGCPSLKSLHVGGCKLLTNGFLRTLAKSCCHLEDLGLEGCLNISDEGIEHLASGGHRIKFLDLNKCSRIGNLGVAKISQMFSSTLKTLKVMDCCAVNDESIYSLAQNCKSLETLVIGGCRNVSDKSVKSLAMLCSATLKRLKMDFCPEISDLSLICVFSNCQYLEILDFGCCPEVSDIAFSGLVSRGTESHLKVLKASGCPKITVAGINTLVEFCKSLEYLDVRSCPQITKADCIEAGLDFPPCCEVNFDGGLLQADRRRDDFF